MPKALTKDEFINKSKNKYSDRFDYSKLEYLNLDHEIILICKYHNHEFITTGYNHFANKQGGCLLCAHEKTKWRLSNNHSFIEKSELKFGKNRFDYSKLNYTHSKNTINLICKKHNFEFIIKAEQHLAFLSGGCKYCEQETILKNAQQHSLNLRMSNGDFLKIIKSNNQNILVLTEYKTTKDYYNIRCLDCGHEYLVLGSNLLYRKSGCPKCQKQKAANKLRLTQDEIINRISKIHNHLKIKDFAQYKNLNVPIEIICEKHGEYFAYPGNIFNKHGNCPKCIADEHCSKGEKSLKDFITSLNINIITNDRKILNGKELDILIPNLNLAIEYNGVYWHSLNYGKTIFHLKDKTNLCINNNIQLIHIYEDEWINSRPQIEQIIKNALGVISNKIFARKCSIWKCSYIDINFQSHIIPFFNSYHHQGLKYNPESIAYCLVYNNQIVACALFGSNKYHNQNECELIRYATIPDTKISGGLSKLISSFHKDYPQFKSIISFCDNRFFTGKSYKKIGFEKITDGIVKFDIIQQKNNYKFERFHRSKIIKSKLKEKLGELFDPTLSQIELGIIAGYFIIPNCGHSKFKLSF